MIDMRNNCYISDILHTYYYKNGCQEWCKPSAESSLFAEVQPILAAELLNSAAKVRIIFEKVCSIEKKLYLCTRISENPKHLMT
jgi:hypothetical protein